MWKDCHPKFFCTKYIEERSGRVAGKFSERPGFKNKYLAVVYDKLTGSISHMFEGDNLFLMKLMLSIEMRKRGWEVKYIFDRRENQIGTKQNI